MEKRVVSKKRYTFPKKERLSLKRDIELLFEKGETFLSFPLRIVYLKTESPAESPVSIMVSVPKKRIRKAADRNHIKRHVRESYRMRKNELLESCKAKSKRLFIAFLYIHGKKLPYQDMERAMTKAMRILMSK
ncbi:MAG: ribonuclease P protein component [Tannerellaceae bacterium]|jgi:ribonuclease P protein component|nr:ribonuclease P protein component [Tannerellaceae bacterium]